MRTAEQVMKSTLWQGVDDDVPHHIKAWTLHCMQLYGKVILNEAVMIASVSGDIAVVEDIKRIKERI